MDEWTLGQEMGRDDGPRIFLWDGADILNARVVMASELGEYNKKPLGCIL